jgi:3'-phosphoadenosine 5'-phosphosulfate sulfotransferase (PAPS reductase)/FAD synthetase
MKHIIQFSGGAASSYVAWLIAQKYDKKDIILLFHDTKTEHEDAYRFRKQVSEFIGIEITEVSDGRDLWQLIDYNHCLPSSFQPFCTRQLKLEPAEKFYKTLNEEFILYNGFGIEEYRRIQRTFARAFKLNRIVKSPLYDLKIKNEEVKRIIREGWKICLPEPYKYLNHNNCIPCFKSTSEKYWNKIWKYYPERFKKAKHAEEKIGHTVFQDYSLSEYERFWRRREYQMDMFEEEFDNLPCMCAV